MKVQDLTAADFPTVDPEKFEDWKALAVRSQKTPLIGVIILVVGAIVGFLIINSPANCGPLPDLLPVIAWLLFMVSESPNRQRLRELTEELGMKELLETKS